MSYAHIVVPLDGSLLSEYVLPQVEKMAAAFNSELTFLHIVPESDGVAREPTPSQLQARTDIVRYLEGLQKNFEARGIKSHWTIRCGDPAEEIAWYVKKHEADMVIMSTHGQSEKGVNDLGSVAVDVLRQLRIPVVLVGVPEPVASL